MVKAGRHDLVVFCETPPDALHENTTLISNPRLSGWKTRSEAEKNHARALISVTREIEMFRNCENVCPSLITSGSQKKRKKNGAPQDLSDDLVQPVKSLDGGPISSLENVWSEKKGHYCELGMICMIDYYIG